MKFFIDTANLDQIKEAQELGVLDGVTTNPSLMAKEGITGRENILKHYVDICNLVDGDVSAEVIATDIDGMIKEGEELAALHEQIVVKIPMIKDGIKALKYFSDKGIKTNCTLVFSVGQALLETFYKNIGDTLKQNYKDTEAWFITSNLESLKHVGLRTSRKIKLYNGSLESRLVKYDIYAGSKKAKYQNND